MPEKEEAVLMDKKSNVCCVFNDPDPNYAVRNMDYELLASEELPNERNYVYRCRRCGNYVLYNIWLDEPALPDFSEDHHRFFPIKEPVKSGGKYTAKAVKIDNAPVLDSMFRWYDQPYAQWDIVYYHYC
jgi:hypothetical protein